MPSFSASFFSLLSYVASFLKSSAVARITMYNAKDCVVINKTTKLCSIPLDVW